MDRWAAQWWEHLRIQHKVWTVLLLLCVPLMEGLRLTSMSFNSFSPPSNNDMNSCWRASMWTCACGDSPSTLRTAFADMY